MALYDIQYTRITVVAAPLCGRVTRVLVSLLTESKQTLVGGHGSNMQGLCGCYYGQKSLRMYWTCGGIPFLLGPCIPVPHLADECNTLW